MYRSPWFYVYAAGALASVVLFIAGDAVLGAAVAVGTFALFVYRKGLK